MNPSISLQEDKYKEKSTMMMIMKGLSPSSIYMRGKGGQQYICGPMPLQATYKDTCGHVGIFVGTRLAFRFSEIDLG
jgi:hypothetical protein